MEMPVVKHLDLVLLFLFFLAACLSLASSLAVILNLTVITPGDEETFHMEFHMEFHNFGFL